MTTCSWKSTIGMQPNNWSDRPRVSVRFSMRDAGPGRFALVASAVGGRLLEVEAVEAGEQAWTDGATIFVDSEAGPTDQLCSIAVQAALLASGSLDADIAAELPRRTAALRRYLAVEGHRALAAQEPLLPLAAHRLIDREVAARSD